jgi:hypothetical protein
MNIRRLLLPTLMLLATTSWAHEDHVHDHAKDHQPRQGGVMVVIGHTDYELVAQPDRLVLHVHDQGKPVSTAGASGQITVLTGSKKTEATLRPAGPNRLEATGSFPLGKGTKAMAVVTLAGQKPATVRFELK